MLKKSLLSIAVIAASVASVSAFAADQASKLPQQKVNVGANVAYAWVSNPFKNHSGYNKHKQGHFGWGVDTGYAYQIMPSFYLGADLGYQDNGKSYIDWNMGGKNVVRSKMVTLLATADYYVIPSWDVFGKFGPAYVMQTLSGPDVKSSNNNKQIRPYISVGTGYTFDNGIYTNIAYDHLFGSTSKEDGIAPASGTPNTGKLAIRSVNTVQLDLGYTFPI
jgi:opacity protein-like surface antigen